MSFYLISPSGFLLCFVKCIFCLWQALFWFIFRAPISNFRVVSSVILRAFFSFLVSILPPGEFALSFFNFFVEYDLILFNSCVFLVSYLPISFSEISTWENHFYSNLSEMLNFILSSSFFPARAGKLISFCTSTPKWSKSHDVFRAEEEKSTEKLNLN